MARRSVRSKSPYEESIGFSRAVRHGSYVAVSGTAPVWPDGHVDPDPRVQALQCWDIALDALSRLGGRVDHVIRTRQYLVNARHVDAVSEAHRQVFGDVKPASTMVIVDALLDHRWLVEVELDAMID